MINMLITLVTIGSTLLAGGYAFDKWSKGKLTNAKPNEDPKPAADPIDWLLWVMGVVTVLLVGVAGYLIFNQKESTNRDFQLAFLGIDPATLEGKSDAYIAGLVKRLYFERKAATQELNTPIQVGGLKAKKIHVTLGDDYEQSFKKY